MNVFAVQDRSHFLGGDIADHGGLFARPHHGNLLGSSGQFTLLCSVGCAPDMFKQIRQRASNAGPTHDEDDVFECVQWTTVAVWSLDEDMGRDNSVDGFDTSLAETAGPATTWSDEEDEVLLACGSVAINGDIFVLGRGWCQIRWRTEGWT